MQTRRLLLPVTLAALVATGAWIHLLLKGLAPETPLAPDQPDFVIHDLRITELTASGTPGRTINADTLRHFSQRDLTETDHPVISLFGEKDRNWRIVGDSARLTDGADEILFTGDVRIDRAEAPGVEPVTITTRDLRVLNQGKYAETAQFTTLASPGHRVSGTGLKAWLETPVRVKLLADVRGHHETD